MLDFLLIAVAAVLLLAGILGAFIPILPGPPLSYLGLLFVHFSSKAHFSARLLVILALVTVVVTLLDLILPPWATRLSGGSRQGMIGATIGLVLGLFFFPPLGIIFGPFLGAFLAEMATNKTSKMAMKSAMGSFVGLLTGTLLKLVVSLVILWYGIGGMLV